MRRGHVHRHTLESRLVRLDGVGEVEGGAEGRGDPFEVIGVGAGEDAEVCAGAEVELELGDGLVVDFDAGTADADGGEVGGGDELFGFSDWAFLGEDDGVGRNEQDGFAEHHLDADEKRRDADGPEGNQEEDCERLGDGVTVLVGARTEEDRHGDDADGGQPEECKEEE